ncbi:hypothetical protein Ga0102493_112947 [Erythrobacter litoralis]|uniref:Uncharacterized protein n=1 Tax=Erythrobacter litoralis TaxID=39960 RepID=A0A074MU86_9SPHN|nr:hypothetical protein [Erythrobacter litoralis]AOL23948.1 hypothetical protein Ga0102493_112947 [Erythrobacter litoralis]KEO98571.1 hypothetical protein EH32_05555 [Erythrobacter litoralis]
MTDPAKNEGAPIRPGEPLDEVLRAARVPPLSDDFAQRVLSRTADRSDDRPGELPPLRAPRTGAPRWRSGRRIVLGVGVFGALAGAAAAAGLFGAFPDRVPAPGELWARMAGPEIVVPPASAPNIAPPRPDETAAPVAIEGAIDTPEELEEVFRRFDDFRTRRLELRRYAADRRLERALERRREQGLPVPSAEQQAHLRERLGTIRERREDRFGERLESRREELRGAIESGEAIERDDFLRRDRGTGAGMPILDRFERLRQLPPEERRERLRLWRERREQRIERLIEGAAEGDPDGLTEEAQAPPETLPAGDAAPGDT